MIYYVDSQLGNDSNDGLSRQTPFQTLGKINAMTLKGGDTVLLKAGSVFHESLAPKRDETEEVIVFDWYGSGKKPLISPSEGCGIDLAHTSYVELNHLAVRNPNGRCGIFVHTTKAGAMKHVHIKGCDVRDVLGNWESYTLDSGGIIFMAFTFDVPSWFEDVQVEDNYVSNVCRSGIYLTSVWVNRPKRTWGCNEYVSDTEGFYPAKNVVFRGNYVRDAGGDGIVIIGAIEPLLEWNVLDGGMTNPPTSCFNAGLWVQATNGAVLQFNEVSHMHLPEGCTDGQGYDVDLCCKDTLVQYNYSHENEGGFLLLCEVMDEEEPFTGTVVRNNVSINDGGKKGELMAIVGPVHGARLENNTFYTEQAKVDRITEFFAPDGVTFGRDISFTNNIFMMNGADNAFHDEGGTNIRYDNNLYWGKHRTVPEGHVNAHVMDPQLVAPGTTGHGRNVADAYRPKAGSPVFGKGIKTEMLNGTEYSGHNPDGKDEPYLGARK